MARTRAAYQCRACGASHTKWSGQCTDCGEWNVIEEIAPAPKNRRGGWTGTGGTGAVALSTVSTAEKPRESSQIKELDRVLGGGIVEGSVILIGGDPGIGKSTLLLQMLATVSQPANLYVSGEESPPQIALRSRRLGLQAQHLRLLTETTVERIVDVLARERTRLAVIDSIQTLFSGDLQSAPGSVGQVRECAAQLVRYAKTSGTTIFLVGHVTKEGALAGPRVLEHMVDTVLYFEGDPGGRYRVLRAVKNRFGAINELGVFAMTESGLKGVGNPSAIFLSRHETPVSGSVIVVTREGSRPMLVEIQSLVDGSQLANPRRVSVGLDQNRLGMLLAILHRHGGVPMFDQDVFVNVVGGVRVTETAADLAVVLAALSSHRDRPLPADLVVFGELGLAGEIRPVPNGQERLAEAETHGFRYALVPAANAPRGGNGKLKVLPAHRLREAIEHLESLG
ncbi:MAG: DNA repair protein RadA [Gammaproteobacteria bacterium]|nr:DNA repair protein RadA [Gammaproteobacteria bacterium]